MDDTQAHQCEGSRLVGWLLLFVLIGFSLALLWLFGVRGGLFLAAAAALLFGGAGYALQGNPDFRGAPAEGNQAHNFISLTPARHAFYGNFSPEEPWLALADGLARSGDTQDAVGLLQNAVRRYPGDPQLWIGLGNALVDHARGLTPPAELAYQHAAELSPGYPAPPFFYGLALARSGDREAAGALWKRILAKTPPNAQWRPLIEQGIAALSKPSAGSR
jgi:cytochrome c-type biogenesis protein CcmH